jgi:deoxyadenosine/deoxycytidine kinase
MAMITVDGNIGSGKSSVLEYIHTRYGCAVDMEPVRKWQPFLNELYTSGKSAFEFQVRVWLDRCWIQQRSSTVNLIMERSPYFQAEVFIPTNYMEARIGDSEMKILNDMYQMTMNTWRPKFYIYLRSNPEFCMERIGRRQRESEDKIQLSYIQHLHQLHEKAYLKAVAESFPILCIDVEGKTVETIGNEIYEALKLMRFV